MAFAGFGGGCAGTIEGPPGASGSAGTPGAGGGAAPGVALIPARIRRLTNAEYDASVQALLGTAQTPAASTFPPDARQGGSRSTTRGAGSTRCSPSSSPRRPTRSRRRRRRTGRSRASRRARIPRAAARRARRRSSNHSARRYRRPLADAEAADLAALYAAGATGATHLDGIGLVVRGALQSAGFLYLTEFGDGAGPPPAPTFQLGAFETASALSFLAAAAPPRRRLRSRRRAPASSPAPTRARRRRGACSRRPPRGRASCASCASGWASTASGTSPRTRRSTPTSQGVKVACRWWPRARAFIGVGHARRAWRASSSGPRRAAATRPSPRSRRPS